MIEPSKEAIQAADYVITSGVLEYDTSDTETLFREGLQAAYSIDFAQLQAERDQLRLALQESQQRIKAVELERDHSVSQFHKAMDEAQERARELDREREESQRWNEISKKLGSQFYQQQTVLQELAEALQRWIDPQIVSGPLYEGCSCRDCQSRAALQAAAPWLRKERA